jgi:hypothetical protein
MQPLPFNGFVVEEEEDDAHESSEGSDDNNLSGSGKNTSIGDNNAADADADGGTTKSSENHDKNKVGADDSARGDPLDIEFGKVSRPAIQLQDI